MSSSGVLGTLVIRIAAEMRQYKESLDTAASATTDTAKKIEKANADVVASQDKLISSAGAVGAAVGVAAVAAAAGVGMMVKSAIDNADAVSKMAAKTGIATETLSAYQHAASLSDVSNETLAMGMKALSKNIADGAEVLGRMGIATKDSQGNLRSLDAVMGDVADKFTGYKDGAGKAALAQEVFGRSGMAMIPMLNDGRAGLEAMRKEAEEMGLVISGQTGKAAEAFNDNLTRLHARSQGYAASLAAQLLPAMTAVTESFIEGGKNSGFMRGAVDVLAGALKGLISIGYGVGAVFEQIGTYFGGIAAAAAAMIRGDFSQVKTIFGDLSQDLSDKAAASGARINQVWSAIGDGAKKAGAEMDQVDAPGKLAKVGKAAKETGDAFAAEREAAKVWERAMLDAAAASSAAAAQTDGLSATERKLRDYLESTAYTINQQTNPAMNEMAVKKWEAAIADEKLAKATMAANKAQEQQVDSLTKGLAKIEEDIAQQKLHNAEIGLGKDAIADLTAARLEDQAAMLEGQAIKQMDKNLDLVQYELLMSQARALRELAALKREGGAAQASVDAAKDATKAWDKFADQVNQSLSDALMDAFMAGKGFGQTFVNSIKSMFNSMVLRPVISAVVGGATGSLGLTGTANAAAGGLGNVGSLASLAGVGGSFGAGLGAGFGSLLGEAGIMGGLDAGLIAMQAGNLAGGLGTLAGVLGPIALGIGAVYMLAKKLDHSGTPHTGGGSQYSAAGGLLDARSSVFASGFTGIAYSDSTTQMTAGITQGIVGILDSAASAFGQKAGYTAAASFADDSSKDGAWGSLRIADAVGKVLTDWQAGGVSFRTFSDGSAGSAEYLAAISADVKRALDQIDLPAWARKTLDALGDAPGLEQMAAAVQQITAVQNAIASQRAGLQQQLDLLTGVTTQREIERNALDESNRALYDQVAALQDQKAAAEAMKDAMAGVNDEVERLRAQTLADSAGAGLAVLQAQFATLTAQARAGSVDAMGRLPGVSQALEEATRNASSNAVDFARSRGWLANSLATTAGVAPEYGYVAAGVGGATGAGSVASVQAAQADLKVAVDQLTEQLEGLRIECRTTAINTGQTNRLLDRVMPDGDAFAVRTAA